MSGATGSSTGSSDVSLNDLSANHNNDLFAGAVGDACGDAVAQMDMVTTPSDEVDQQYESDTTSNDNSRQYLLADNAGYQAVTGEETESLWNKALGKTAAAAASAAKPQMLPNSSSYDEAENDGGAKASGAGGNKKKPSSPSAYDMSHIMLDGDITGGEAPAKDDKKPARKSSRKVIPSSDYSIDGESALLWGDDPEKAYFAYMMEQEAEARALEGKDQDDSLMAESTRLEILRNTGHGGGGNSSLEDDTTLGHGSKAIGWEPSTVAGGTADKISTLTPSQNPSGSTPLVVKNGQLIIPNVIYVQDGTDPDPQVQARTWNNSPTENVSSKKPKSKKPQRASTSEEDDEIPEQALRRSHRPSGTSRAAARQLAENEEVAMDDRDKDGWYTNRLLIGFALFFLVLSSGLVAALILYRNHYAEEGTTPATPVDPTPVPAPTTSSSTNLGDFGNPLTFSPTPWPTLRPTPFPTYAGSGNLRPHVLALQPARETPTWAPTGVPTWFPTKAPSFKPVTEEPTRRPTFKPTPGPTGSPTSQPTSYPTYQPTASPTFEPTKKPTSQPTDAPTSEPSTEPTALPSFVPSFIASEVPTSVPSIVPTGMPTSTPTKRPTTAFPTARATPVPTAPLPTQPPLAGSPPNGNTTVVVIPPDSPTSVPSNEPLATTANPTTRAPATSVPVTSGPVTRPPVAGTRPPVAAAEEVPPTASPSKVPTTARPSKAPTTKAPTTARPSKAPTTKAPTTNKPSPSPTPEPSQGPPTTPTTTPPTKRPSPKPTFRPTNQPTPVPTIPQPSKMPTPKPTPTPSLTESPSNQPPVPFYVALETVKNFLLEFSPMSTVALDNEQSTQYQALVWLANWMASIPPQELGRITKRRLVQRWALAVLYLDLNGPNWTNGSDDWMGDEDHCNWLRDNNQGSCNQDDLVMILDLSSNNLRGTLPQEIALLSNSLARLEMDRNDISGPLPIHFGRMRALVSLDFTRCDLTGTIPTHFGDLRNLAILGFGRNDLQGTIPSEFGRLSNLVYMGLERNDLRGTIPTEIASLSNLAYIALDWNALTGAVPPALSNLDNLRTLILARNSLVGEVPSEFCERSMDFLAADCDEVLCPCCDLCCENGQGCAST